MPHVGGDERGRPVGRRYQAEAPLGIGGRPGGGASPIHIGTDERHGTLGRGTQHATRDGALRVAERRAQQEMEQQCYSEHVKEWS